MKVLTAWSMDEKAAAMSWRFPALAEHPFPTGVINYALAHIYNHENESLDHPYLFIVRDADNQIIGLVITDPEGVALDQPDINVLYATTTVRNRSGPAGVSGNVEGDVWAIEWPYPSGHVFPVDPINAILAALYNEGCRPFIYPVWDRADEESELRQVGLILSPLRELPGDASENWRALRDVYRTITSDEDTYPHDVPWGQKEWNLE